MGEKHPDRTQEWQKQKQALQTPKIKPEAIPAPTKEIEDEKKIPQ